MLSLSNSIGSATTNSLASRLSFVFSAASTAFQSCSRFFHSRRSHRGKHYFLIDQSMFSGVVMLDAIVIIVYAATAHISRCSDSRPPGTTADDLGLHMINCHIWHLLSMLPATAENPSAERTSPVGDTTARFIGW